MNDLDPKTEARVEVITNALLHLPIRGKELQFAARQIEMALMQAGHLSATVPAGDGELVERLRYRVENPSAWPEGFDQDASDLMALAASRLSQAGVRTKPSTIFQALRPYFRASVSHVEIIEVLEAALSGDTL